MQARVQARLLLELRQQGQMQVVLVLALLLSWLARRRVLEWEWAPQLQEEVAWRRSGEAW